MCVHVSVCVDGMNLKCALLLHIYTAVHSVQCQRTHTHAHARYLGTANRRGLQVDTAGIVCVCVCVCEREREREMEMDVCGYYRRRSVAHEIGERKKKKKKRLKETAPHK